MRIFKCAGTHLLLLLWRPLHGAGSLTPVTTQELFVGGMNEEAGEEGEAVGQPRVWRSDKLGKTHWLCDLGQVLAWQDSPNLCWLSSPTSEHKAGITLFREDWFPYFVSFFIFIYLFIYLFIGHTVQHA